MGRGGYGEIQKSHTINETVSPAKIREMKEKAILAARISGVVVEGEFEEKALVPASDAITM